MLAKILQSIKMSIKSINCAHLNIFGIILKRIDYYSLSCIRPIDQKEEKMKQYETMYIVKSSLDDASRAALINDMHAIITNHGGSIDNVDEWGMRDFAYRIDDMTKGYYVVVTFTVSVEGLNEFTRLMGINSNIVRLMTICTDEKK